MTGQRRPDPIRTFNARKGRLGSHARATIAALTPRYGIPDVAEPLDLSALYGNSHPIVLEIGFGMGEATAAMAAVDSATNVLAVEVHPPGVARLLALCRRQDLTNVRVFRGDALALLHARIPGSSLQGIRAFFPDPWPKTRHHKRRLVQSDRVALMRSRLTVGGFIHVTTDWRDYAVQMLAVLTTDRGLRNCFESFAPDRLDRPVTRYEQRGRAHGHPVWDLRFERTLTPHRDAGGQVISP